MGPVEEHPGDWAKLIQARRPPILGEGPTRWLEGVSMNFAWHQDLEFDWSMEELQSADISIEGIVFNGYDYGKCWKTFFHEHDSPSVGSATLSESD